MLTVYTTQLIFQIILIINVLACKNTLRTLDEDEQPNKVEATSLWNSFQASDSFADVVILDGVRLSAQLL